MAIRGMTGFDGISAPSQLNAQGSVSGALDLVAGLRAGGGQALRKTGSGSVVWTRTLNQDITNGRTILHFRYRRTGDTQFSTEMVQVRNTTGSAIWNILITTAGDLNVRRGGTTLLSLADAVVNNVTAHWIVDVVIHSSAGSVTVYKDGAQVGQVTGVNTQGASGNVRDVRFGWSPDGNVQQHRIDDFCVEDAAVRGQLDVIYYPVDEDVSSTDWDPSTGASLAAVLDEVPGTGADYMVSSLDNAAARFGITPTLGTTNPLAVQVVALAQVEEASTSELELKLHSGASDDGGRSQVLTTSLRQYVGVINQVDPDTGNPWSPGDLDLAEIEAIHQVPA